MAKMVVPQGNCGGVDVDGVRYRARDGILNVPDHLVSRLKRNGECFEAANPMRGVAGFVCESCGFHAVFRTCGRCGGRCHRPEEMADATPQAQA